MTPLPQFIEHIYAKRFGREWPEVVVPIEQRARQMAERKAGHKAAKMASAGQAAVTEAWPSRQRPRTRVAVTATHRQSDSLRSTLRNFPGAP